MEVTLICWSNASINKLRGSMKWNLFLRTGFLAMLIGAIAWPVDSFTQTTQPRTEQASTAASLRMFLQKYTETPANDKNTSYFAADVNLNAKEVIVYLVGADWCGSGGCATLVLAPSGLSYRVVTKLTVARPPIRVLAETSNGWHNIGVWVSGGGVSNGYEAVLRFNGKTYPSNPTLPPAQRSDGKAEGKTVVPKELKGLEAINP